MVKVVENNVSAWQDDCLIISIWHTVDFIRGPDETHLSMYE